MSKRRLIDGIGCIAIAVIAFLLSFHPQVQMTARLTSLASTYIVIGGLALIRYFYYNSPGYREFYREKLEYEEIEQQDERMLRLLEKSRGYTYQFGQELIAAAIFGSVILEAFGMIEKSDTIAVVLGGFLIVQIIAEQVIFRYLSKKY